MSQSEQPMPQSIINIAQYKTKVPENKFQKRHEPLEFNVIKKTDSSAPLEIKPKDSNQSKFLSTDIRIDILMETPPELDTDKLLISSVKDSEVSLTREANNDKMTGERLEYSDSRPAHWKETMYFFTSSEKVLDRNDMVTELDSLEVFPEEEPSGEFSLPDGDEAYVLDIIRESELHQLPETEDLDLTPELKQEPQIPKQFENVDLLNIELHLEKKYSPVFSELYELSEVYKSARNLCVSNQAIAKYKTTADFDTIKEESIEQISINEPNEFETISKVVDCTHYGVIEDTDDDESSQTSVLAKSNSLHKYSVAPLYKSADNSFEPKMPELQSSHDNHRWSFLN